MFEEHLVRQFGICAKLSLDEVVKREFILWLKVREAWTPSMEPDNDELPRVTEKIHYYEHSVDRGVV